MSVVACVVAHNAAWIAYDGRAVKDEQIITENEIKAEMINDTVCVGYTGTLEVARAVTSTLRIPKTKTIIDELKSDSAAVVVQKLYAALNRPENAKAQFVVVGINSNGKYAAYIIDQDFNLSCYEPSGENEVCFAVLSNGEHGLDPKMFVFSEIKLRGLKTKAIKVGLKSFICAVAKKDPSVNDNVSFITLRQQNLPSD